uniref:NADH dehydrogenase subunit 3 n=1 Tax=Romanomermis culicivorax TaxID=13658 RepID=A0A915JRG7_ROMCU
MPFLLILSMLFSSIGILILVVGGTFLHSRLKAAGKKKF